MSERLTSPLKNKKKSVSLPRIKQVSQQINTNKGMNNIHKVKWSMAPKCLIPGHQGNQILYVCIHPQCTQQTRLVCQQCFFKNHCKHNQHFLAVDQIKKGQIQKLRYWPFGVQYRKIFQFVTKHQAYVHNMVQDINATFNSMAMRIINSIDKIRLKLLKKIDTFYIKETTKQKFSQKVKNDLEECFQLKKISQIVRQLFSKQIRHQVFQHKMKNLLKDQEIVKARQTLLKYFNQADKGKDMNFDKMHFSKKQTWIIQQIDQQKKALKQQVVTIDQTDMGIQKIIIQTIDYLDKHAQGMYPLTFQKKQLQDGSIYNGFIHKGLRSLFGMRVYKNKYNYYGQWKNGAKSGWGIYQNKDIGYRYEGQWKQDRKWGYGKQSTIKWTYEGTYVADKKQGFGVFIQEGVRYQIGYKNDKKNGQGKRIQKNGNQTQIYYLNGVQSKAKATKTSPTFDIKELSKRFTSVKSHDALSTNQK